MIKEFNLKKGTFYDGDEEFLHFIEEQILDNTSIRYANPTIKDDFHLYIIINKQSSKNTQGNNCLSEE